MPTYKNTSDQTQTIIGVGVVAPGETVQTDTIIENGNFAPVGNNAGIIGTEQPQASVITDAAPVDTQPDNSNEQQNEGANQ